MQKRGTRMKRTAAMYGSAILVLGSVVCVGTAGAWTAHCTRGPQNALAPAQNAPLVTPDTPLNRQLVEAVQRGDMEAVRVLCQRGASADTSVRWLGSGDAWPVALLAARHPDEERPRYLPIFQWLVVKSSDPNAADERGQTLLMAAIDMDDLRSAQILVSRGADINAQAQKSSGGGSPLHCAVMQGGNTGKDPSPITLFLLEHGAKVNARDDKGTTPLILAAQFGKMQTVKALLAHGANPSLIGMYGMTALYIAGEIADYAEIARLLADVTPLTLYEAAQYGKLSRVQSALDAGADPNKPDPSDAFHLTALMNAMQSGSAEMAKLLLRRGANIGAKDKHGRTALHHAAMYGDSGLANLLLDRGADVNAAAYSSQLGKPATPLTDAVEYAQADIVDLLLKRGAELKRNGQGAAALQRAITGVSARRRPHERLHSIKPGGVLLDDRMTIIQHLLKAGADARADNSRALYLAASNAEPGLVSLLLANGADVNGQGLEGDLKASPTPLLGAVEMWAHKGAGGLPPVGAGDAKEHAENDRNARATVELLLFKGADVNWANGTGQTPLMCCDSSTPPELTQMLLAKGANVNAVDEKGRSALMQAAADNDLPFATLLLAHKADAARHDKEGRTSLMLAIDNDDNALYILFHKEDDEDARLTNGEHPPPIMRKDLPNPEGHPDMVRLLLKNGADPNAAAKDGTTPLKLARKNGFEAVVKLLRQAGAK